MTRRAVVLGLLCVLLIAAGTPYSDLVMRGTWIGLTALPISAVFLLTLLVFANAPLRRNGHGLTGRELLLIFCMTLVSAGIPSFGLTGLLVPYLAGPLYFASPENHYKSALLAHLPHWMMAPNTQAARWLYEGLPAGASIPWASWIVPLGAWAILVGAVYLVFFCTCALLRRPWAGDEKIVFPLMQLPIEIARYEGDHPLPPLLRDWALWLGFAIPFCIHFMNGLARYFPVLPTLNVAQIDIGQYITGRVGQAVQPLWIRILFSIIGLTYLLPTDVAFSLWICYFFFLAQQAIAAGLGYDLPFVQAYPVREMVGRQMIGGVLVFGVYLIWNARGSLRQALRPARGDEERQEPMSPRWALRGIAVGFAIITVWGSFAGSGALLTLVLFLLFLLLQIVAVRLVAQAGMLYVQHPYRPLNLLLDVFGSQGLGASHIPALALYDHLWMLDNRSPLMPEVLQGFKVAESGGISQRGILGAMALSVIVAVPVSLASYLYLMYTRGGLKLNPWFTTYYTNNLYAPWATGLVRHGQEMEPTAFLPLAIGALTMLGLLALYRNFYWWPIHPLGYLMGASWPMVNFWFSVFVGWLFKVLVLRYGGARAYRRCIPFALGLILGEFFAGGLWVLIDFSIGMNGHEIFSF